jgi:hypothetical protein
MKRDKEVTLPAQHELQVYTFGDLLRRRFVAFPSAIRSFHILLYVRPKMLIFLSYIFRNVQKRNIEKSLLNIFFVGTLLVYSIYLPDLRSHFLACGCVYFQAWIWKPNHAYKRSAKRPPAPPAIRPSTHRLNLIETIQSEARVCFGFENYRRRRRPKVTVSRDYSLQIFFCQLVNPTWISDPHPKVCVRFGFQIRRVIRIWTLTRRLIIQRWVLTHRLLYHRKILIKI